MLLSIEAFKKLSTRRKLAYFKKRRSFFNEWDHDEDYAIGKTKYDDQLRAILNECEHVEK